MGANPFHKDIFLEMDYEELNESHSHQILPNADLTLINAFSRAPKDNPDNKNGINFHLDAGHKSIMIPGEGFYPPMLWGDLSEANSIQEGEFPFGEGDPTVLHEFQSVRSNKLLEERRSVFQYGLSVHSLPYPDGQYGGKAIAVGCRDFIISNVARTGPITGHSQGAGIMHEIGHTFGLGHGGGDDEESKPNYFSIMNYRYPKGLMDGPTDEYCYDIGYSNHRHIDLDENSY